ncbi:MAG: hypothetical protein ACXWJ7_16880, partial [Caldimonas sp.]
MAPLETVKTSAGAAPALPHEAAQLPADSLAKRRRERLRMLPMVAASYGVDTVLLCAYYAAGSVPWQTPPAYLVCGLMICAAFHLVLDSSLPERVRD